MPGETGLPTAKRDVDINNRSTAIRVFISNAIFRQLYVSVLYSHNLNFLIHVRWRKISLLTTNGDCDGCYDDAYDSWKNYRFYFPSHRIYVSQYLPMPVTLSWSEWPVRHMLLFLQSLFETYCWYCHSFWSPPFSIPQHTRFTRHDLIFKPTIMRVY